MPENCKHRNLYPRDQPTSVLNEQRASSVQRYWKSVTFRVLSPISSSDWSTNGVNVTSLETLL